MRIDRAKFAAELARKDMNVKRLAERSGISRVTVSSVKCGKTCAQKTVEAIANALGVKTSDIIQQEAN